MAEADITAAQSDELEVIANPQSGTRFTSKVSVTLRVSPQVDIHYTTDGTTPTKDSPVYGEVLVFAESTTLRTFVSNGDVTREQSFTYIKKDAPDPGPGTEPEPPTQGVTLYVKAASAPFLYVWSGIATDLNGSWPGNAMSETEDVSGETYYVATFAGYETINFILSNDAGEQTSDINDVKGNAFYEYNGSNSVTKLDVTLSVNGVEDEVAFKSDIWVSNGTLYLRSDEAQTVWIYRVDGSGYPVGVKSGVNAVDGLARGVYIVNGVKVKI